MAIYGSLGPHSGMFVSSKQKIIRLHKALCGYNYKENVYVNSVLVMSSHYLSQSPQPHWWKICVLFTVTKVTCFRSHKNSVVLGRWCCRLSADLARGDLSSNPRAHVRKSCVSGVS